MTSRSARAVVRVPSASYSMPAERAAARQVHRAADEARLRLRRVVPVEVGAELLGEPDRDADVHLAVGAAGLDQEDAHARVRAEAGGQDAAGRAGSDDDVVVGR